MSRKHPNPTLSPTDIKDLRNAACTEILYECGLILARLNHPESGRIAETMFQLLPTMVWAAVDTVVLGKNDSDEISRMFIYAVTLRIADKLHYELDEETLQYGAANILSLLRSEQLRRTGYMEYSWANDIFSQEPSDPGCSKLTEAGRGIALQQVLHYIPNGKYVQ